MWSRYFHVITYEVRVHNVRTVKDKLSKVKNSVRGYISHILGRCWSRSRFQRYGMWSLQQQTDMSLWCISISPDITKHVANIGFWHWKYTSKERFLALKAHKQGMPYTGTWPCKRQDRDQGHWQRNIYLIYVKRLFVSMKKHATRTAEAHHCASFAPSSEAPPAHQHNNSNNKKHLGRFPADD